MRLPAGENFSGSAPMSSGVMAMSDDGRFLFVNGAAGVRIYAIPERPNMGVAGRQLFYNNSSFDGNSALADAADDGAVATDKAALLPGGPEDARLLPRLCARGTDGLSHFLTFYCRRRKTR